LSQPLFKKGAKIVTIFFPQPPDSSFLPEEISGLQYALRGVFVIALPVLILFTVYNIVIDHLMEAAIVLVMGLLLLISHFIVNKPGFTELALKKQYNIYQNIFRGFLLLFLIYIIYTVGYQKEITKIQWSYIFPLLIFFSLGRREAYLWALFFIGMMAFLLFCPHLLDDISLGFKFRYLFAISILCATGIAWKAGIRQNYVRLRDQRQKLFESEEKYRLIFENCFDIIYTVDGKLIAKDISPAIEEATGYSPAELIGRPLFELNLLAAEDTERAFSDITRVMRGSTIPNASYNIIAKDGTRRKAEISAAPIISNGEVTGMICIARNVTARKKAEEEKQESTERLQMIVNNAKDVIWMLDMNLQFIFISPSIEQMSGYTVEEYLKKPHSEILVPSSLELLLKVLEEELANEKDPQIDRNRSRTIETEQITKNGSRIWVELKMNFIYTDTGKAAGILGFSRNITESKQLEAEKQQMQERLRQAERLESLGVLAGGIAHNFNNLLGVINGYTSLALLDTGQFHPNYEKLKRIEEEVKNGAKLTGELLGFARGGKYEIKPTNINNILEKTSSVFGTTKKEISFLRQFEGKIWNVEVDQVQMEQVFMNLYLNSQQAMPGGGNIYLTTENIFVDDKRTISPSLNPGKYVKITIKDTGLGMDEKTKARIFEPFFTTKKIGIGTGLGLATVYGIIRNHNGVIFVKSSPGEGTTFDIYLPASEKEIAKEKKEFTTAVAMGKETILLVDDEKPLLEVNKELLKCLGYEVYATGSGQGAIAVYMERKDTIDLVILDMIMPGISGGETFDHLKKINPDIKVLLSSGYSIDGQAQEILSRGCKGFLQKPFNIKELSRKVIAALSSDKSFIE